MRIFLVRHGDADADIPEGMGDEARALTAKARHALVSHFTPLVPKMGEVNKILTSPLVRTVQTAQLLSSVMQYEGALKSHRSLLPDMPVGAIDGVIEEHAGGDLVLVGHQPTMGALAAHLLSVPVFPKSVSPGTVICLETQDAPGRPATLGFYASPGHAVVESLD